MKAPKAQNAAAPAKPLGLWQRALEMMKQQESVSQTISDSLSKETLEKMTEAEQIIGFYLGGNPALEKKSAREGASLKTRIAMLVGDVNQLGGELAKMRETHETIFKALGLTPEQRVACEKQEGNTIIGTAIKMRAERAAVAIAAGQGCAPIPALPQIDESNRAEDALEAFNRAAGEPDPKRRGELFAKAEKMMMNPTPKKS